MNAIDSEGRRSMFSVMDIARRAEESESNGMFHSCVQQTDDLIKHSENPFDDSQVKMTPTHRLQVRDTLRL